MLSPKDSRTRKPRYRSRTPRKSVSKSQSAKASHGDTKQDWNNTPEAYWDIIAHKYTDEVMVSIEENNKKSGAIKKRIEEYSKLYNKKSSSIAADFGCGCGKYLLTLSEHFKRVVAMDFSQGLLDEAQKVVAKHKLNVTLARADLTSASAVQGALRCAPQFGICMNVLLSPDPVIQRGILKSLYNALADNAHLLLLVPSFEARSLTTWAQLVGPLAHREANREEFKKEAMLTTKEDLMRCVIDLGDSRKESVRTQHYLKEMITALCLDCGFKLVSIEKAEYEWKTSIYGSGGCLPKSMSNCGSGPWDWLLVLEKS